MEIVYVNQDALEFQLDTETEISGATSFKMGYKKPDGTKGELDGSYFEEEKLKCVIAQGSTVFDTEGEWHIWSIVTFSDGRRAPGKPRIISVRIEGEIK